MKIKNLKTITDLQEAMWLAQDYEQIKLYIEQQTELIDQNDPDFHFEIYSEINKINQLYV